jgi:hypothetical protein
MWDWKTKRAACVRKDTWSSEEMTFDGLMARGAFVEVILLVAQAAHNPVAHLQRHQSCVARQ